MPQCKASNGFQCVDEEGHPSTTPGGKPLTDGGHLYGGLGPYSPSRRDATIAAEETKPHTAYEAGTVIVLSEAQAATLAAVGRRTAYADGQSYWAGSRAPRVQAPSDATPLEVMDAVNDYEAPYAVFEDELATLIDQHDLTATGLSTAAVAAFMVRSLMALQDAVTPEDVDG